MYPSRVKISQIFKDPQKFDNVQITVAGWAKNIRCSNLYDLETYLKTAREENKTEYNMTGRNVTENAIKDKENPEEQGRDEQKEETAGIEHWIGESMEISVPEQMEEFMFLGLRMMEGVSSVEFEELFGQSLQEVYGKQLQKLMQQELLEYKGESGRYALTLKGIDVSNRVFVEFIN